MKKKIKPIVARNATELAEVLGLPPAKGLEMEIRSSLTTKIVETVEKKGLTHAEVAKLAKTSRTRITSILNRNLQHVSTDLLLRILGVLGYQVTVSFSRAKLAA